MRLSVVVLAAAVATSNEVKTPTEVREFGGEAGRPYDACYHRSCDRKASVDIRTLVRTASATLAVTHALAGA